jgi:hypothetical protein
MSKVFMYNCPKQMAYTESETYIQIMNLEVLAIFSYKTQIINCL